jgi:ribosomal-protein-alanine N-acetyltransferase
MSGARDPFLDPPAFQLVSGMAAEEALGPIMEVMQAAFDPVYGEAWNHSQARSMLAMPLTHTIVAEIPVGTEPSAAGPLVDARNRCGPGQPIGFSMSRRTGDEEELLLIAVTPQWRHFGAGSSLLHQVIDNAQEAGVSRIFLEMRSNNPASHLYHKFGFQQVGLRKNYYKGADSRLYDALTLALTL